MGMDEKNKTPKTDWPPQKQLRLGREIIQREGRSVDRSGQSA